MQALATLALIAALAPAAPGVGASAREPTEAPWSVERGPTDSPSAGVRVDWSAPPGCDGEGPLRRRLDAHLARAPAGSSATGEVRARLRPSASGAGRYAMDLEVRSSAGVWRRSLDGEGCDALIAAAALIAAINLDPLTTSASVAAVMEDASPEVAGSPSPAVDVDAGAVAAPPRAGPRRDPEVSAGPPRAGPRRDPEETPEVSPEDEPIADVVSGAGAPEGGGALAGPSPRRRLGFTARAGAGAIYGPTPRLGALLLAGIGLSIGPRALVEVSAIHRVEDRSPVAEAPTVEVASSLTGARVDACGLLRRGSLEVPLCAGFDLASLRAEAIGLTNSTPSRALHAAVIAEARLLWRPAPSIGLGLDLGGGAVLTRWAYSIGGLAAPALTTTPALGHVGLSFEVRLP